MARPKTDAPFLVLGRTKGYDMHPDFDPQPHLQNDTLRLRPLRANDLDPLYAIASDPEIWAGHPVKTRHQRAVFEPYFDMLLSTHSTLAICDATSGQIIGCSRYYAAPDHRHSISSGIRFWAAIGGAGQSTEA